MIYHSLFHSVLTYGIVFWGTSPGTDKLFKLQKRVIHIMTGQGVRTSRRDLFKEMKILRLKSQYIFSILFFVAKKIKKLFLSNYDGHNVRTRQRENLHYPSTVLTLYQNGVYFMGIKIFNKLPSHGHKKF
jgi:hypothetical protein